MKPTRGRWSKDLKTAGALEEAQRAEQRSKLCRRDLQLSQNHHWFLSQLIQLCPWLLVFFFSHCALSHGYKQRECRAGDKEVWEWGRGRRTTINCSSEGVFSSEFHFFPTCYLPTYPLFFLCTDPSLLHSFVTSCILQTQSFPARDSHITWLLEKVRKILLTVDRHFSICTAVNYHSFFWIRLVCYESHQINLNNSIPAYFLNFGHMAYFWKSQLFIHVLITINVTETHYSLSMVFICF